MLKDEASAVPEKTLANPCPFSIGVILALKVPAPEVLNREEISHLLRKYGNGSNINPKDFFKILSTGAKYYLQVHR